jgi:hypothetical protein
MSTGWTVGGNLPRGFLLISSKAPLFLVGAYRFRFCAHRLLLMAEKDKDQSFLIGFVIFPHFF